MADQSCGVPGRSCGLNLVLVRDVLSWAEQRGLPLALLSLDQEKAFDRVAHGFLFQVLEHMGFGPVFCSWVRLLYTGAVSRVKIRGRLSGEIAQAGGVRQGCPLSPLLYVLSIEPLVARLRQDPGVVGVHLPGGQGIVAKVTAYADDLTLFLTTRGSFEVVAGLLGDFGQAAGARVNLGKSAAMGFGLWGDLAEVPGGFRVEAQCLRILGVDFVRGNSGLHNWRRLLVKVSQRLALLRARPLSLSDRVCAVKTYVLPVLNHLAYVFPAPYGAGRRLDRLVFQFVWAGQAEFVSRGVMCRPVAEGGRGVPRAPLKVLCLHVAFQARLVVGDFAHKAAVLARFWLGFPLRAIRPLDTLAPWSWDLPWHYGRVVKFLRGHQWCLEGGVVLRHRELYAEALVRDEVGAPVVGTVQPVAGWLILQPKALGARARDLAWLAAMNRLPVRERVHRLWGRGSPLCPFGCGQVETVDHALWSCPEVTLVWSLVGAWLGPGLGRHLTERLVVRGEGLRRMRPKLRWVLWVVASECKRALWDRRTSSIRRSTPLGSPQEVFAGVKWAVWGYIRACGKTGGHQEAFRVWGHLARAVLL